MYKNIYVDRKTNTLHVWDDVGGYNSVQYQDYAYRKKDNGKYRSLYGDSLEKTTYFSPKDPSLFESDVPLDTKFLIDLYGDSDSPSTGIRTGIIDIETDISDGFPTVEKGDKTITAIALYDYISRKYIAYLLDKEQRTNIPNTDSLEVICCDNEYSLLDKFLQKWQEFSWDVVTSWNGNGFDMPYLYNRISNVMGRDNARRLSPIGICYVNKYNRRLVIAGISHLDYMELFKKYMDKKEPSYALNPIGKKYVNLGKIEFNGSLDDLYKNDIAKYIEYNINDVKIIVELDKKFQFIELARKICHVGHVSYENFEMSSRYLEGAILVYMRRNGNLIAPNKSLEGQAEYLEKVENDEEGFSGAYVKDPIPGRYDWIYDLDLTSMYPNIIISLNISPETKICKIENWNAEQYANGTLERVFIMGQGYSIPEFKKFIQKHKFSIASNGCIYSTDKRGIIPSILIKWFDERKEMRKLAKKYADEKNWEQYDFYDQRQKVQKIMLNSAYGALGLSVFRFYDKDNAEAVTTTGVTIIKSAAKAINAYYTNILGEEKDHVIYIDTDSVGPNSIVKTNLGEFKIKDLFNKLINQECECITDIMGKVFLFPINLQMPYYDESNSDIKYGNVKYIEKHKVKKVTYRINTKHGKCVEVTADHSVMVIENGKLIEKKPVDLKKNDKIITIM